MALRRGQSEGLALPF